MNRLRDHLPIIATFGTFLLLVLVGSLRYTGFFSARVFLDLLGDNAFLGVAAIGMTFVILAGGIDLSVGSMIGFTSIVAAVLLEKHQLSPALVLPGLLLFGAIFGASLGALIHYFALAPFLVTLAGMFFLRGAALVVSQESLAISHPFYLWFSEYRIPAHAAISLPLSSLVLVCVFLIAVVITTRTRFGRAIFAIGGNEVSARLMGVAIPRTKILFYSLSGTCAALAGILYTFYTSSGNATAGGGLELDAIAAVVIGGTLLTGGSGSVLGTLVGVLILGLIQTAITFESGLSSWWTKIFVATLLFLFVVFQKALYRGRSTS